MDNTNQSISSDENRTAALSAAKSLDSANTLVFVLSVIGSIILFIVGLAPDNSWMIVTAIAGLIPSFLIYRFIETYAKKTIVDLS